MNGGADAPIALDMQAVTREALGLHTKRAWSMEYLSNSQTFKWTGFAYTQDGADLLAREELDQFFNFDKVDARLVAALEVR